MARQPAAVVVPVLLLTLAGAAPSHAQDAQGHRLTEDFVTRLLTAAVAQTTRGTTTYDGSYRRIPYPGGDVPLEVGVCTDVVIRAYRQVGIDLQVELHEDMRRAFSAYPQLWGLRGPDSNIDHRRVPNLATHFRRVGAALPVSQAAQDYRPGDLVTWMLPGNLPHIGIVTASRAPESGRPLIVHNIGRGPEIEDMLFAYTITGHFRYGPGSGLESSLGGQK